jgi:DNA-binding response OmpR family regulator
VSRLLLAEDDDDVRSTLARALRREGYEVDEVRDGLAAAQAGIEDTHDLLLLDLGLPGIDGLEVCRRVRAARPAVGILIITGRSAELDAVAGLDAGADDYVAKPFRLAELLARVRARVRALPPDSLEAGDIRVDPDAHRAWHCDTELGLSPKEFDLLELLVRNQGRTIARDRIMREVWGGSWFASTKALDMHVLALRRKLGDDAAAPRHVITVRGIGLRLEP